MPRAPTREKSHKSKPYAKPAKAGEPDPLHLARPKNMSLGASVRKVKDLTRFVRWPKYVRLQRQRSILNRRLKVPPAINHFTFTLNKNAATNLFKLLLKYRPETRSEKRARLREQAANEQQQASSKPHFVKYGLNHIVSLVESKEAKLVIIAHDVDPIELVVFLPVLCRRMGVPYCIVKGKARLGQVVHKKTATALAITSVRDEDVGALSRVLESVDGAIPKDLHALNAWGGGVMGAKSQARQAAKERAVQREQQKRM